MSDSVIALLGLVGFTAGCVDAIAGGGGLVSLPCIFLAGVPPHAALGTNKFQSCCGTTIATLRYAFSGKVDFSILRWWVPLCLLGSALGSAAILLLHPDIIKPIFIPVFFSIGIYMLIKKETGKEERPELRTRSRYLFATLLIFIVGFYDGFFGPGTGVFLLLIMVLGLGFDALKASGTGKLMNWCTNIAALSVFLWNGKIDWTVALVMGACNSFGGFVGAHMAIQRGQALIRWIVVIVVFVLSLKLSWEYWP